MSTVKAKHFHLIDDMDIAALALAAIGRVEAFTMGVKQTLATWIRRSNQRRELMMMSEHMLEDIGLTRFEIARETAKYFWQK